MALVGIKVPHDWLSARHRERERERELPAGEPKGLRAFMLSFIEMDRCLLCTQTHLPPNRELHQQRMR